jgi:N-acetylmuramoyl-L-alanine amidase
MSPTTCDEVTMQTYSGYFTRRRKRTRHSVVFALLSLFVALGTCPTEAKTTGKSRQVPIDMIVIHSIGGPTCVKGAVVFNPIAVRSDDSQFWKSYLEHQPVDGIHYIVGRDGSVAKSIPEDQVANHASNANGRSIGIELVNRGDGKEPYPNVQIEALVALIKDIRTRYVIPLSHIVRHADVDQRMCRCGAGSFHRRQDPGEKFPLESIRAAIAAPGEKPGASGFFKPMTGDAPLESCG